MMIHQQQPEEPKTTLSCFSGDKKKLIFSILVIILAIITFSLTIFALQIAVNYFSYLFSITEELIAKKYLEDNYPQILGAIYLSIFGQVIVIADTIVFFTKFTQKNRLLCLHITFFLPFFICGLVAVVGSPQYVTIMTQNATSCGDDIALQCIIAPSYLTFRGSFTTFYALFCVFFIAYTILYHIGARLELEQREQVGFNDQNMNNKPKGFREPEIQPEFQPEIQQRDKPRKINTRALHEDTSEDIAHQ